MHAIRLVLMLFALSQLIPSVAGDTVRTEAADYALGGSALAVASSFLPCATNVGHVCFEVQPGELGFAIRLVDDSGSKVGAIVDLVEDGAVWGFVRICDSGEFTFPPDTTTTQLRVLLTDSVSFATMCGAPISTTTTGTVFVDFA